MRDAVDSTDYFASRFQFITMLIDGGAAESTMALNRKRSPLAVGEY